MPEIIETVEKPVGIVTTIGIASVAALIGLGGGYMLDPEAPEIVPTDTITVAEKTIMPHFAKTTTVDVIGNDTVTRVDSVFIAEIEIRLPQVCIPENDNIRLAAGDTCTFTVAYGDKLYRGQYVPTDDVIGRGKFDFYPAGK